VNILNNLSAIDHIQRLEPIPTPLRYSGKLQQSIQCVLFDIYGTLFISGSGDIGIAKMAFQQTGKLEKLFAKFKINLSPQEVLDELFSAIKEMHEYQRQRGIDYPEVVIENIWLRVLGIRDVAAAREFAVEFEWIVNPVFPMPHLSKMLSACREMNVLMGIISNAQFYTPHLFKRFLDSSTQDLGFDPDLTFYSYACGYAKPSTFMFEAAANRLQQRNISASSTLYIGNDMLNDIAPAKTTGFSTALFAGDARSLRLRKDHAACRRLSADLVITDLLQILDHLDGS
jgi:putative hydrolase of the HAD superfamily